MDRRRLLDTAVQLVSVPSRTGEAGAVADRLASLLTADGFAVERPEADHPAAPAVVVRLDTAGRAARCNSTAISTPFICRSCRRRWRTAG